MGAIWVVLLTGVEEHHGPSFWGTVRLPGRPRARGGSQTGRKVPGWISTEGDGTVPPATKRYSTARGARGVARSKVADIRRESATGIALARIKPDGTVIQVYPIPMSILQQEPTEPTMSTDPVRLSRENIEASPWDRAARDPGAWHEITEARREQLLNVLPPIYKGGGFAVSEAIRNDDSGRPTYLFVVQAGGRVWARELALDDMIPEAARLSEAALALLTPDQERVIQSVGSTPPPSVRLIRSRGEALLAQRDAARLVRPGSALDDTPPDPPGGFDPSPYEGWDNSTGKE